MMFKCHWFDNTRNVKVDKHGITTVNVKSQLDAEDVFILASHAVQIYYAPNISTPSSPWYTVVTGKNPSSSPTTLNEKTSSLDNAFQEEVSNTSSSHIEPIIIENPSNFFIDLTQFENNNEIVSDDEENIDQNEKSDSDGDEIGDTDEDSA